MDVLTRIHPWTGYVVLLVVVAAAWVAFGRARASRELETGFPVAAMVLVDLQVALGIVIYAVDSWWEAGWMMAWAHPLLMLAALGVGHAAIGRARKTRMVDDAWRTVGRGLLATVVLLVAGIGVASAA